MAPVADRAKSGERSAVANSQLRSSTYDAVASMMLALVILLGIAVGSMLLVWLSTAVLVPQTAVPVVLEQIGEGGGRPEGIVGESIELDEPDGNQMTLETGLAAPALEKTLSLAIDAAGAAAAGAEESDTVFSDAVESGTGRGRSRGDGRRMGKGFGEGLPGVPRAMRWEIMFAEGNTLAAYAQQLDYFKIELGVVGEGGQVHYAYNLSKPKPDRRTGRASDESRLYMSWRSGTLQETDRTLLARAGIAAEGRVVLQFYPSEVENQLAQLERQFAGREASGIHKTRFGVKADGRRFAFYVTGQSAL